MRSVTHHKAVYAMLICLHSPPPRIPLLLPAPLLFGRFWATSGCRPVWPILPPALLCPPMVSDFSTLTPLSGSVLWTVSANSFLWFSQLPFFRPNKGPLICTKHRSAKREAPMHLGVWVSLAAVTKQCELKNKADLLPGISEGQRSKMGLIELKLCVSSQCSLVRLKERIPYPWLFQFLEAAHVPGSWPASILKPYYVHSASPDLLCLSFLRSLTYKDPCDYIRPMSTIQSNSFILKFLVQLSLQGPFACKVTHS